MTEVVEETEPESSFKETDKKHNFKPNRELTALPHTVRESEEFAEEDSRLADRDDDFTEESEDENTKSSKQTGLKDFTFTPGKKLNKNGHTFMEGQDGAN